jgi:endonuclease YncB( thermonuclease family)
MWTAFVSILAMTLVSHAWAQNLSGRVVGVTDGDTMTLLDERRVQHKIRLAGIDAPERKQPFGQRSKEQLAELVAGKTVEVETEKMDRYGRTVGKVIADGKDANLAMVVSGFAWHDKKYQDEQSPSDRLLYDSAEKDARAARRGLWADQAPISPSDWRAGTR